MRTHKRYDNLNYTCIAVYSGIEINSNNPPGPQTSVDNMVYTVSDLRPYTTYEFRVRAATIYNDTPLWGDYTQTYIVTTDTFGKVKPLMSGIEY